MAGNQEQMTISVVMPAFRAEALLPQVLPPLIGLQESGEVIEVIVVDDRSPDDTAARASEMGARVLVTPVNGGPGAARNLASKEAGGDILWFVDSDVIARPDGVERIRLAFTDPNVGAVFGSYDDEPQSAYWFSQYKNLLHHFHHQRGRSDAQTFWAGCGAVRKDVFHEVGGFDTETYEMPSIEDIELGYRISRAGYRIVLDPLFLCKHLKHWTIANAIETDIFKRALPWSRLMISREGVTNDLNASTGERLRAVLAFLFLLSVFALPFVPAVWPLTILATVLAFAVNAAFFRLLLDRRGPVEATLGMLYHQVYYVYSATVFAWCLFEFHILGRKDKLGVFK